ncbi:MAG: hypothetical protein QME07_05400 [bacterium]|nr:hypothetical protein [bacterium]
MGIKFLPVNEVMIPLALDLKLSAELLNIEDFLLAQKIEEVDKDEFYEPTAGKRIYQILLKDKERVIEFRRALHR